VRECSTTLNCFCVQVCSAIAAEVPEGQCSCVGVKHWTDFDRSYVVLIQWHSICINLGDAVITMAGTDTQTGYFDLNRTGSPSFPISDDSMSIQLPSAPTATVEALTALQYLPIPLLVLSSQKTVVLANEAMGRLLGIEFESTAIEGLSVTDTLRGQSMAELGVDILQNGSPIMVSWEVGQPRTPSK
jgi:hypothetical protein